MSPAVEQCPDQVTLTPQERLILELIGRGFTPKEAAAEIDISPRTIEAHLANARRRNSARHTPHLLYKFGRMHMKE